MRRVHAGMRLSVSILAVVLVGCEATTVDSTDAGVTDASAAAPAPTPTVAPTGTVAPKPTAPAPTSTATVAPPPLPTAAPTTTPTAAPTTAPTVAPLVDAAVPAAEASAPAVVDAGPAAPCALSPLPLTAPAPKSTWTFACDSHNCPFGCVHGGCFYSFGDCSTVSDCFGSDSDGSRRVCVEGKCLRVSTACDSDGQQCSLPTGQRMTCTRL